MPKVNIIGWECSRCGNLFYIKDEEPLAEYIICHNCHIPEKT